MQKEQLLTQTMAFLLCTTTDTTLGKLLQLCLAAKVDAKNSGKGPLEFAEDLLQHPETISSWISEVVDSDDRYSVEEMVALSEMNLKDPQKFMQKLLDEMTVLDTQGL
ncbi:hypothetical protein IQ260_26395 [Leptolyngbya cf. ectocarpi LEGE 11479]|uniref:Uncharacterized protein n=1 Tax=Leptolyngbya cf. ectocarpi LEGE 11479 TaxID=1828722 RepID=A0A929FAR9_LEPEC|nr:hypothetical protein [Leptolyngbya ectocarpi]MBE9070176.1 hypothetical protein [Leptolyngbya cf. ectocarpi LEGE 11479]